jgi:hypothetical protein
MYEALGLIPKTGKKKKKEICGEVLKKNPSGHTPVL